MSEKKKSTENTEQKEQKVVTKYDLKMQRRKEQKEKEKKQERISTIVGIVIVIALVCLVASFPIRTYLALHETYVKINGEDVTRVEFDYNYNLAKNNYMNQYGSYMAYFGMDLSGDLSTMMYSDTLTWKDYFEQAAVDNMTQNKALKAQAQAEGFTYDTDEDFAEYEENLKNAAAAAGVSVKQYIKEQYGSYATQSRIKELIEEAMFLNAYYEHIVEMKTPADEDVEAHYKENPDAYDSVDYRLETIDAEFPTEPTDLADADGESDTGSAADGTDGTGQEQAYVPSDAEIDKAMADAKVLADAAEATIAKDGELTENARRTSTNSYIREWLFDSARKAGDTTVIEDLDNGRYFVVAFEKRYRDETPSVDARVLITDTMDGQTVLDEWKSGEATEESFGELCKKYSIDYTAGDGGLYEQLVGTDMDKILAAWLYDEARQPGDVVSLVGEDGSTYVMYYVRANDPEWKLDAKNTLLSPIMEEYITEIKKDIIVEDPKGRLNYLKAETQEDDGNTDADNSEGDGNTDNSEDTENAENSEGTENAS